MLSLFNISVKKNLGLLTNEIKTLDDSDRGSHTFFLGEHVCIFAWKKYLSGRASAEQSANQHPVLINEWQRHALTYAAISVLVYRHSRHSA